MASQDGRRNGAGGAAPASALLRYPPISDYALIGDCHGGALVSRDGSIDWCAFHRFVASPVFGRILDWERGGHFRIAPRDAYRSSRRYLPDTNVLETMFETHTGTVTLTDFFDVRTDGGHPDHRLLRIVRCTRGKVPVVLEFEPRFDYGLTVPRIESFQDRLFVAFGGPDALVLQSDLPVTSSEVGPASPQTLREGDEAVVILTYQLPHDLDPTCVDRAYVERAERETTLWWQEWAARCTYRGPYREQVVRSALVLKALTNAPTGAIVAAATSSLPEEIGGERNWDYRYSWLRDSSLTLNALFALGYDEEAEAYMAWLRRTTAGRAEDLQIMYGVGGERFLPEVALTHLEGYRGSAPVRIGNGAAQQFQLDVYGELLDTAWLYAVRGGEIDEVFWSLLRDSAEVVARKWNDRDSGIWEIRGEPRHFTYSKVMAWVTIDRVIRLAELDGRDADLERLGRVRDEIRTRIEREGVHEGVFTQSFDDGGKLDASNLMIPIVGFVDHDDARARATVEAIADELSVDGFVYRYVTDGVDGLSGDEATFVICSFWLVECLARGGEVERARELFEQLLARCNDVGLLAEEIDPHTGELVGNFPQAFSHLGLIQAAIALDMPSESMSEQTAAATVA
jgi:GH15 family glucan-1,4-alpha-glucosidase